MNNLLDYLEKTAEQTPNKLAVADREHKLSFAELAERARRIGGGLCAAGISSGAVGVITDRDADAVVMLLGVLYSGAFYVPLDPTMPAHKREAIMEDSGMRAVVGHACFLAQAGDLPFFTPEALTVDSAALPHTGCDDPAYMVYTSGSTGKPKGVLKSHGAVRSFIEAFAATFALSGDEVIGNQTPFFFDASAKDLYLMLYTGARLEVLPTELFALPVTLIRYLNERKITYICWVPTALAIVTQLNTFLEVVPKTLRHVFFVGEVFPPKQLRRWREALPQARFVNLYGASELAGICCWYEVRAARDEPLPMGKPLGNCRVFLLDEAGREVSAPGILGEVCIISPALATCYYGDPEKTARQFVTMRLDGHDERVFRSGDLARYDENHDLVFSCRSDFQIKHMGRRIELGEIEAAAVALPDLEQACCLYNEAKKRITLFCTLQPCASLDGRQVQRLLKERLSDYMVPAKVIVLERMPLNANGKIDRMALKQQP